MTLWIGFGWEANSGRQFDVAIQVGYGKLIATTGAM